MAKINQGIFGAVQGKVGNLVGSSYKGIPVLKSKAASVANPQTADQTEQRNRMTSAVTFAKLILALWIKPLWDRFAVKMSGYNLWIQKNVANFEGGELQNPEDLIMSVGNMAATTIDSLTGDATSDTVTITWTPDTTGFHLASDIAYVLVYVVQGGLFFSSNSVARSVGACTVSCPDALGAVTDVEVWLVFKRTNGLYISLASHSAATITA